MTVTNEDAAWEDDLGLTRAQKRLLRRIYNGRTIPIVVNDTPFLTYKEASHYLLSLAPDARNAAYAVMKDQAKAPRLAPDAHPG
ncbi:MAG: hypothetical protein RLZZ136_1373 [Pseudomonadota bacterium]